MNSYGHSLTTSTSISAPEQVLDFSYKMPLLKNPLEQYYLVQGGFKRTDLNDTEQDSTTLAVSRYWDLSSGWQRAINLRWSFDHFTQERHQYHHAVLPGRDDQPNPLARGTDANLGRFAALFSRLFEYGLGLRRGFLRAAGAKRLDSDFVRSPPFCDARQFGLDRNR